MLDRVLHIILMLFMSMPLMAQLQLDRQVIGAAGMENGSGSVRVVSTIGEVAVTSQSSSSLQLTEGFQQPLQIQGLIGFSLNVQNASCIGRSNGFAEVSGITGCPGPYQILWSNGQSGQFNRNLSPGTYTVQILNSNGCQSNMISFEVSTFTNSPCLLTFYSGVTPNGDGINDQWEINNIEAFPNNTVNIYDRHGIIVFSGNDYDNQRVVWKGTNVSGGDLPSDTYFYVFTSDGIVEKGWIELTR